MRESGTADRDRALRRLRRATSITLAGAGVLVAVFAGIAAKAVPGRHAAKSTHLTVQPRQPTQASGGRATPPPLVPAESAATPAPPAAPTSAPTQSQAPPVAVSGGS